MKAILKLASATELRHRLGANARAASEGAYAFRLALRAWERLLV